MVFAHDLPRGARGGLPQRLRRPVARAQVRAAVRARRSAAARELREPLRDSRRSVRLDVPPGDIEPRRQPPVREDEVADARRLRRDGRLLLCRARRSAHRPPLVPLAHTRRGGLPRDRDPRSLIRGGRLGHLHKPAAGAQEVQGDVGDQHTRRADTTRGDAGGDALPRPHRLLRRAGVHAGVHDRRLRGGAEEGALGAGRKLLGQDRAQQIRQALSRVRGERSRGRHRLPGGGDRHPAAPSRDRLRRVLHRHAILRDIVVRDERPRLHDIPVRRGTCLSRQKRQLAGPQGQRGDRGHECVPRCVLRSLRTADHSVPAERGRIRRVLLGDTVARWHNLAKRLHQSLHNR